ncbi:MAG: 2-amino-4-hydroxy-6-hydroxymethyldihydropteridine diphosphokinase [Anaerolineae bacterium]|nr:2-amino-4-hydroxy-6-hydroxymethyldihydropteridine diphosphokinase [Anaerolineae bacterium]
MSNLAFLSLGSNIHPEENLAKAVEMLARAGKLVAVSPVWETLPWGVAEQPNFLNAATVVETNYPPETFKHKIIRRIEDKLGRVRNGDKFGPRPIDIDIMLFNDQIFDLDNRHIPDPEVIERPFVAIPLAQIAPDYRHPETGQTLRDIARRFDRNEQKMRLHPAVSQALAQLVPKPGLGLNTFENPKNLS